jgi:hypothetical protein
MIDDFGGFLVHNLIVCVAVVLLPLKWLVVRVCRDREAESVAIISVPEDLCYVVLGLILGDVINKAGSFRKYFALSEHLQIDEMITIGANILVAIFVHLIAQWTSKNFKKWRAAVSVNSADKTYTGEIVANLNGASDVAPVLAQYFFLFSSQYLLQLALAVAWLHWVAGVLANT